MTGAAKPRLGSWGLRVARTGEGREGDEALSGYTERAAAPPSKCFPEG